MILLLVLFLLQSSFGQISTDQWIKYNNQRYKFSIDLPKKWIYVRSYNDDGVTCFEPIKNSNFEIRVYASKYFDDLKPENHSTSIFKINGSTWIL